MNFIKKLLFFIYNPFLVRDSSGKVIDDIKRHLHSRKVSKDIKTGNIKHFNRRKKCYPKGQLNLKKSEN